jgi:Flp pilus assembly protein TadD
MSASAVEPTKASPENVEKANKLKEQGNHAFAKNDHASAIKYFTEALTFDPTSVAILSNRSAAYAAIGKDDPEQRWILCRADSKII